MQKKSVSAPLFPLYQFPFSLLQIKLKSITPLKSFITRTVGSISQYRTKIPSNLNAVKLFYSALFNRFDRKLVRSTEMRRIDALTTINYVKIRSVKCPVTTNKYIRLCLRAVLLGAMRCRAVRQHIALRLWTLASAECVMTSKHIIT